MRAWGRFVHRHRGSVLAASLLVFVAGIALLVRGGTLKNTNSFDFESGRGFAKITNQLPRDAVSFDLVIGSPTLTSGSREFATAVTAALAPLARDPRVTRVSLPPLDTPTAVSPHISADRHYVVATVAVRDGFFVASAYFPELRGEIHSEVLTIRPIGELALNSDFTTLSESDLKLAETISLPLALILLLIVFASLPAALLCLFVGGAAVIGGVGATFALSRVTDVSIYALNIVSLIGLGVAIDYSLFIVNRFRDELRAGTDREAALAAAMATAGRAIAYSGLTVAAGLCGLLFYQGTFMSSLGFCGAIVVTLAVLQSMTLLPAMLAYLGPGIDRLSLPRRRAGTDGSSRGFWHGLALRVMRRPWLVLVPCLALLLLAGSPSPQMRLANASVDLLPPTADSRQGADLLTAHFPAASTNTITAVLDFGAASPLDQHSIAAAYAVAQRIAHTAGVATVSGYVALDPSKPESYYAQSLYGLGPNGIPDPIRAEISSTVGNHIAVLHATTTFPVPSDQARDVVRDIRAHDQADGVSVDVTGDTAFDLDFVNFMVSRSLPAVLFVMAVTFVILLVLLRSVILPVKAVIMNLLSLSAAFGAMVFIFQQGHLSGLLNFTPASIDPTLPILLFCIIYGLSMDYEVFLLTRMQEAWGHHHDNRRAVAEGLEASGRLVTGAAAIMIGVFAAFALASVVVVKSVGLGMAIAVFVDATIVRALVVPALMRLMGDANWWAPSWMRRRLRTGS